MISYTQYTAKLITTYKVFNNAKQVVSLKGVKLKNVRESRKHSIDGLGVRNLCVFVVFTTTNIPNPKSQSS